MNSSPTNNMIMPTQGSDAALMQMQKELNSFKDAYSNLTNKVKSLEHILVSQRVQISNFEGLFKIFAVEPDATKFREGAMVIFNDSGTIKLGVNVERTFYYTTLT